MFFTTNQKIPWLYFSRFNGHFLFGYAHSRSLWSYCVMAWVKQRFNMTDGGIPQTGPACSPKVTFLLDLGLTNWFNIVMLSAIPWPTNLVLHKLLWGVKFTVNIQLLSLDGTLSLLVVNGSIFGPVSGGYAPQLTGRNCLGNDNNCRIKGSLRPILHLKFCIGKNCINIPTVRDMSVLPRK